MNVPFPLNPAVGQFFGNWVWNGARWVCSPASGVRVVRQVFTTSGPYMPSPGLVTADVECVGGGGVGGWVDNTNAAWGLSGGGGGSGAYSKIALAASLVAGGVQVTIGAGGVDLAKDGGTTSFGALCVAAGGTGGGTNTGGTTATPGFGEGGAGGALSAGIGDLVSGGASGAQGITFNTGGTSTAIVIFGGAGGNGPWGGGATDESGAGGGNLGSSYPGQGPGAGGAGAAANEAIGNQSGGAGSAGICVVTEYCWADSGSGEDCGDGTMNVNARVAIERDQWRPRGPGRPDGFEGEDFGDA